MAYRRTLASKSQTVSTLNCKNDEDTLIQKAKGNYNIVCNFFTFMNM